MSVQNQQGTFKQNDSVYSFIISSNGWTKPVLKSFVSFTVFTWFAANKQVACHATSNIDQHIDFFCVCVCVWELKQKKKYVY